MASAMAYVGLPLESLLVVFAAPWQSGAAASSRREELWLEGGWDSSSTFFLGLRDSGLPQASRKHNVFITAPGRLPCFLVSYRTLAPSESLGPLGL